MITAAKLGSAPLTLDWTNLATVPQRGSGAGDPAGAWSRLRARLTPADVAFYDAPTSAEISQAAATRGLAAAMRGRFQDCLFLGIGGSALGPISLLSALQEAVAPSPRLHFLENPDPLEWKATLARLDPARTLVCAVTKSGTTFETLAQLLLALDWLGRDRWKTHCVAITDPAKGDLRAFAAREGIPTLDIHPAIGGRFSVFSPVGLFPAELAGLDTEGFLLGARQVREYVERAPVEKNALFALGGLLLRHAPQRTVHACMPYSTRLRLLGSWFVQLWGESLGKDGKGFTPLAAVGATDQHSLLQLLRDGPDDKVTLFITVDQVADEVRIPRLPQGSAYPAFRILEGHSLHELLGIEYRATAKVLTQRARPHATFQLDRIDARGMGALYFAYSLLTAYTGTLWEVNPFDQPGVEEAKVYIRESLGQSAASQAAADDDNSPVGRLRRDRS
jgi:glucose-6-phosphate isomerase